jgi:hypothetical protein
VHFTSEEANSLEELLGQWVRPRYLPVSVFVFRFQRWGWLTFFLVWLLCWVS